MKRHLPRMPNFSDNLPVTPDPTYKNFTDHLPTVKFDPFYTLGPPVKSIAYQTLLDTYFNGDVTQIYADMLSRPDHYDAEQKDIIERLRQKQPLKPETQSTDVDELVMRFFDRTEQRKKREEIVSQVQKKMEPPDDPTVRRKLEEDEVRKANETFEVQRFPKSIKII